MCCVNLLTDVALCSFQYVDTVVLVTACATYPQGVCLNTWNWKTYAFSALTLLVGRQEGHPACKKTERWGSGMVICLERGAELHMAQRIPLPLTVSCFSKIQIGFTFLVLAHLGGPGQRVIKRVCVCVWKTYGEQLTQIHLGNAIDIVIGSCKQYLDIFRYHVDRLKI